MKKEIILKLSQTIGECKIDVEAKKGHSRVEVFFLCDGSSSSSGFFEFEDYQLGMMAEFFSKAYNEIKNLHE